MQLASQRRLAALALLMLSDLDQQKIVERAVTASTSLVGVRTAAVYLDGGRLGVPSGSTQEPERALDDRQVDNLPPEGGALTAPDLPWAWAYPLAGLQPTLGFIVVAAGEAPDEHGQYLLRTIAQQTGAAIRLARLYSAERAVAARLREANTALEMSVAALTRNMEIHRVLTQVSVNGGGETDVADALYGLTGLPVVIEDLEGHPRVWAGPGPPDPPPPAETRTRLIRRLLDAAGPVPVNGRLVALVRARADPVAVIALIGAASPVDYHEREALEHAATVLGIELLCTQRLVETELHLGGDLVDVLLSGTTLGAVRSRIEALGYDPRTLQCVAVVDGATRTGDAETFFQVVRRAALDIGVGGLVGHREAAVVVVCAGGQHWNDFRKATVDKLPGGTCRVGVGGVCDGIPELPQSYQQAQLALRLQRDTAVGGVTVFDDLGFYRLVGAGNTAAAEAVVRQWLGELLDYDERRKTDLVRTLSVYLDVGGRQERAATTLSVHPSTLKYRLQRIREVSGFDLRDPEARFNLQIATRTWRTLETLRAL